MNRATEIAPRSGAAFELREGQALTVIDPQGMQVADLLAYSLADVREVMVVPAGTRIDIEIFEDIYFKDERQIVRLPQ